MTKPEPDLIALLARILTDTPRLEGAACIEWPGLHDPAHDGEPQAETSLRHEYAVAVCRGCPALFECNEWALTEPTSTGVLAGRIPTPARRRGRPAA